MTTWTENNPVSSSENVEGNKNLPVARTTDDGYSIPLEGDPWYEGISFTHWDRNADTGTVPTVTAASTPSTFTETEDSTTIWTES
jgi:hypothetical protein